MLHTGEQTTNHYYVCVYVSYLFIISNTHFLYVAQGLMWEIQRPPHPPTDFGDSGYVDAFKLSPGKRLPPESTPLPPCLLPCECIFSSLKALRCLSTLTIYKQCSQNYLFTIGLG